MQDVCRLAIMPYGGCGRQVLVGGDGVEGGFRGVAESGF